MSANTVRAEVLGASAAPRLPPVIGHRGAAARAPENTLAGLRRAKALGCAWIEFDVRLTVDGAPVLCHDATLERTTDGTGLVAAQTLAAIRHVDAGSRFDPAFAGERVPTLDEALALAAEFDLGANIEIKVERGREYATAASVAASVDRLGGGAPALLVSSFVPSVLTALRAVAPRLPRGILFRAVPRGWAGIAARLGAATIGADHRWLRPRRVAEIRDAGYQLAAFTVNDPARARLLFAWGVASVFSDAPDIILKGSAAHPSTRRMPAVPHGAAAARQGVLR